MGPRNLRLTGEMADGWLGNAFIPEAAEVFLGPLREGTVRAGRTFSDLDLVAPVAVEFYDDEASADTRHAVTPTDTRSPSVRWALTVAISITTRSRGWATAQKSVGSPNCGKAENETRPAGQCRLTSAASRILLAHLTASPRASKVPGHRHNDSADQIGWRLPATAGDARTTAQHRRRRLTSSFSPQLSDTEWLDSHWARGSAEGDFSSWYVGSRFNSHGKAIRQQYEN